MKLKEIPGSLGRVFALSRMSAGKLALPPERVAENCIVSFTSIPSRLKVLHLTVRSLLAQELAPEKIFLWLNESLSEDVPSKLKLLLSDRFEIRYSNESCAHRKLVESLRLYPQRVIVTCDDDVMYPSDWLAHLWRDHLGFPRDIIAHECRCIRYDNQHGFQPYNEWVGEAPGACQSGTLAIGYGGTLYPPASLHDDVCNSVLYDRLAPRADDLWFKAMSLLKGTRTRRATSPVTKPIPIMFSQQVSLKKHNVREDGNSIQWQQLDSHYDLARLI